METINLQQEARKAALEAVNNLDQDGQAMYYGKFGQPAIYSIDGLVADIINEFESALEFEGGDAKNVLADLAYELTS